jgi:Flp pilus assembly protein TadG
MIQTKPGEKGQVIIIIAVAIIILLGFTGLAIDAGMVYSDRRFAQNAADAAALAGAAEAALDFENQYIYLAGWDCNNSNLLSSLQTAVQAAINRAGDNTFVVDTDMSDWNGVNALCHNGVNTEDKYADITVRITTVTPTTFVGLLFPDDLVSEVEAVARVRPRQPALAGFAIASMWNCSEDGDENVGVSGGGNSGGVESFDGGIFINSTESASGGCCGLEPPTSTGAIGIRAEDPFSISSVGSCEYDGEDKITPSPITTNYNGGAQLGDPLSGLAMPSCTGSADTNGYTIDSQTYDYGPGNISGSNLSHGGTLAPGIYCITGDVTLSGQETLEAYNVVLYFIDGGLRFTGQGGMSLTAPIDGECSDTDSSASPSCTDTYQNIAIIAARDNTSTIEVRGNGGNAITGMIYALSAIVQARGGGSDPSETEVTGQIIASKIYGDGNGSFKVTYEESRTYEKPTNIELNK